MNNIGKTYWGISFACGIAPALAAAWFAAHFGLPTLVCGGAFWIVSAVFVFGILCSCNVAGHDDQRNGRDG